MNISFLLLPHLLLLLPNIFYLVPSTVWFCFLRAVQSSQSAMFNSLRTHGLQHARPNKSITNSQNLLKLMPTETVMPSNHLILCRPLLLLPSIFPSIRVFSNESAPHIRWPKYWSFNFSISPFNEYPGLISFRKLKLSLVTFNFPLSPGKL